MNISLTVKFCELFCSERHDVKDKTCYEKDKNTTLSSNAITYAFPISVLMLCFSRNYHSHVCRGTGCFFTQCSRHRAEKYAT